MKHIILALSFLLVAGCQHLQGEPIEPKQVQPVVVVPEQIPEPVIEPLPKPIPEPKPVEPRIVIPESESMTPKGPVRTPPAYLDFCRRNPNQC